MEKWYLILILFDPQAPIDQQYTMSEWATPSESVCLEALEVTADIIEKGIVEKQMVGVTYELMCEQANDPAHQPRHLQWGLP